MKLKIDDKIFEHFPSLNLGVVVVKGIDNTGESPEVISLLTEQMNAIKTKHSLENFKEIPELRAWQEAYRSFGAKAKYTCSVENLYRMILDGVQLHHINKLVDIYNYFSLKHLVPVGGDDTDKIDGDIVLRLASGDEPFIKLGAEEVDRPKAGEVIYIDDKEVLCRRWNWRECDKSKMTEQTKNATLVVEGLSPVSKESIQLIVEELGQLVKKFCGGEVSTCVLNAENKEVEI